jgi:hypothetical protein
MILNQGAGKKKGRTGKTQSNNTTLQLNLEDQTTNLSAKEAQVFYSNASNAQQIMNQRRLKQRFAAASVIANSNH